MSEETTRDLSDKRSFEERVFARFDAIDACFGTVDARFDTMEARFDARFSSIDERLDGLNSRVQSLEAKALDTKPIWEQALVAIVEVQESIYDIKRKFEIVTQDLLQMRADQRRVERRMDALESRPL